MLIAVWLLLAALVVHLGWQAARGERGGGPVFWVAWAAVLLLVALIDRGVVS